MNAAASKSFTTEDKSSSVFSTSSVVSKKSISHIWQLMRKSFLDQLKVAVGKMKDFDYDIHDDDEGAHTSQVL